MDYTLSETHEKIRQMADKMGSDYFVLPVILNFFETATLDFVGEKLNIVEKTQTVSDDIAALILTKNFPVIQNPNFPLTHIAALPADYLRQVAYSVFYNDLTECRRADLKRHAELSVLKTNPNRKPTKLYPVISQEASQFNIDAGPGNTPTILKLTYCKKPTYATTGEPNTRIVNLPDDAIEKILLKTVKLLFNKTDDDRMESTYAIEEAFRKVFK